MITEDEDFPQYWVSQPPHDDGLEPTYYKVCGSNGSVFWRNHGHKRGRETTMYDLLMEERNGFGIERLEKENTPWNE